jgi:hypothetical protein
MLQEYSRQPTPKHRGDAIATLAPLEQGHRATRRRNVTAKKPAVDAAPVVATVERGRDGQSVRIPAGCTAIQGADGRMVALPPGFGSLQGSDGRVVAIPKGHLGIENAKGRVVPKARW